MPADAGFLRHPTFGLAVEVGQVTKGFEGEEVALQVFDARLDDALLLRIMRWTRINLEAVAFSAIGIRSLESSFSPERQTIQVFNKIQ